MMQRARSRVLTGYLERHHVVPKCLGGTDELSNIVSLTPEEHYVAHQLLVRIHPKNNGLLWAAVAMTNGSKKQPRKNKLYGWLRRQFAKRIGAANRGRKVSDEARSKMSLARTGKKLGPHSIEHKKKLSEAKKGRVFSDEHRAALAAAKLGKTRQPHSEATKAKMRESQRLAKRDRSFQATDEHRALQSERMKEVWRQRKAAIPAVS